MKRMRNWIGYPILAVGVILVGIGMVLRHGFNGATIRLNKMTDSIKKVQE